MIEPLNNRHTNMRGTHLLNRNPFNGYFQRICTPAQDEISLLFYLRI